MKCSTGGIQYVHHHEDDGETRRLVNWTGRHRLETSDCAHKSGPSKSWIKVRNPKSPAYLRISDGTF